MNIDQLNHALTPDNLRALNQQISECLLADSPDKYQQFNTLINERDQLILSILGQLDNATAKQFAQQEMVVNDNLKNMAQTLLKSAKDDVSQFIRSQTAIKKYK
ncbi:hypothetical protein [Alteromonas sp. AMM-1]|uniref:hypothetical protein n=1 Tax=Alteromonas sp. AMM-1 TaxID=3394233 RepID=UPI0039A67B60